MNQERPDEAMASEIVKRVMGIQLEHADKHGGVDYISPDRAAAALEVTTVTGGLKKSARRALSKSETDCSSTILLNCWIVFVADTHPESKTLLRRVQPMVVDLEMAGESEFDDQSARLHICDKGELSGIYERLLDAGVEGAVSEPHRSEDPDHIHRICVSTGSGGSVNGSDESLENLLQALGEKPDNAEKLRKCHTEQRHLFVWLDDDTEPNIAFPLSRETLQSRKSEGWGLPTTDPQLDAAITHLWVVHDRSRLGWLWDGAAWRELQDL